MKKIYKIFCILISVAAICTVSACGRYSEPYPVENSGYPHNYPQK